jgi:hypothetical protein
MKGEMGISTFTRYYFFLGRMKRLFTNKFCVYSTFGRLSYLPRSLLVALVSVPLDVLMVTGVALWKSPCMLLKGWQRLCEDLVGREGPFLETVCVPFAGLAIVLWPLAVIAGVIASFLSSFFLGLHAGLIAYQVLLIVSTPTK